MRLKVLSLSLLTGLSMASVAAFAEPAVQAGETLESLSKVKVTTTVNGQPGSLQELVSSGKVKVLSADQAPSSQAPLGQEGQMATSPADAGTPSLEAPVNGATADAPQSAEQPNAQSEAPQLETPAQN